MGAPAAVGTAKAKSPVIFFQNSLRLHASVKSQQSTSSKRKKYKKSGSSATAQKRGLGQPVSREEVSDHVSTRYNQGLGGPLGEKVRSRGLPKRTRASVNADECDAAAASGEGGLWDEKQEEYLKMLNGRPALVLNADYMVGRNTAIVWHGGMDCIVSLAQMRFFVSIMSSFTPSLCVNSPSATSRSVFGLGRMLSRQFLVEKWLSSMYIQKLPLELRTLRCHCHRSLP